MHSAFTNKKPEPNSLCCSSASTRFTDLHLCAINHDGPSVFGISPHVRERCVGWHIIQEWTESLQSSNSSESSVLSRNSSRSLISLQALFEVCTLTWQDSMVVTGLNASEGRSTLSRERSRQSAGELVCILARSARRRLGFWNGCRPAGVAASQPHMHHGLLPQLSAPIAASHR